VVLSLKDKWIWDFWLVSPEESDDRLWHIYFLQADNTLPDPNDRHRNVTQGHAVSSDLVNWAHKGTCFAPSKTKSWDDWTTWTGSVVKDDSGLWHLFYTGTMHDLEGLHQRIGHATSTDMHSWQRVGDGLCLDRTGPNASHYEEYTPGHWHDRAMRDPWVMRNPDGDGWIMYFTARTPGREEANAGGAIGYATSPDLNTWTLQKSAYTGGAFGQLEVPQVFQHDGRWYMAFCTWHTQWSKAYQARNPQSPVAGTSYLTAPSHLGPWEPAVPFFDGHVPCQRYAGKFLKRNGRLEFLAFLHDRPDGSFVGTVGDPLPVKVLKNGTLSVENSHG
jgi:beta-fructofuranosidase